MGLLDRVRFRFFDSAGMVRNLIEEWKPGRCKTEKEYEKSLYGFLHGKLDDIQITKQYARGRIRADIVVGDEVIIELKNNLNTTAKYQRLMGQLMAYDEWRGPIIVVLTGDTDPNLLKELHKYVGEKEDDWEEEKVIVVEKRSKR